MTTFNSGIPILIIDVQGFRYKKKEFILKELAAVCVNTSEYRHYIFKPPYPFCSLSHEEKKQYRWLERNYLSGIQWRDGHSKLSELPQLLHSLCRMVAENNSQHVKCKDVIILCKGTIKKSFLQPYFKWNTVLDLDDLSSLPSLKLSTENKCLQHANYSSSHCALGNVFFIKKCMSENNIKFPLH